VNRRSFLRAASLPLLAPALRGLDRPAPLRPIGLQLYTVRDLMERSVSRTLERVAAVGYDEVEFAGYFGEPPRVLRSLLDAVGLASPSAHLPLEELERQPETLFDAAEILGHRYLIVPSLAPEDRRTLDDYRRVAGRLNRAGERALARGLRVGYHNHDFELERIGDTVPYDILLAETDPALVCLEMDFYWMTKGGGDPLAYFERQPGRFHLCHVKDMDRLGRMTDVGDGRIDFARILRARERAGLRHFFVEHDHPRDPRATISASYRYLSTLRL
jgi:sugar phosphate isomerase/epimerase